MELYNEDCLEGMKRIPDGSIDAIITDPPFWTTACKWDSVIPFEPMWKELKRIIKPNGAIVLFWSEPFSSALRMSNIKNYKYDWIWEKSKAWWFMQAKNKPLNIYENISVFTSASMASNYGIQPSYFPYTTPTLKSNTNTTSKIHWDRILKKYTQTRTWYPKNILKFNNEWNTVHPTQKPVALIEYLIKTYTNEWETVLDFTMWSGTTWVACKNTNRNFIWFEMDKWYYDIAVNRIK